MNPPKVSVIIPSYNKPEYLPECLRSVQAQTFTDWECIVVNDGSPRADEIRAAVAAMNDPRFRLVEHEKNRGLAAVCNTGVRAARAELVIWVDEDDWIRGDCLERLLHHFRSRDADVVCPYALWAGKSPRVWRCRAVGIPEILRVQPLLGAGFLMTKSFWRKMGGWDEHPILRGGREDVEWWIRAVLNQCKIAIVEEPLYSIREPMNEQGELASLSVRARRNEILHRKYIVEKHREAFKDYKKDLDDLLKRAYAYEAWWHEYHGNPLKACMRRWQVVFSAPTRVNLYKALRTMAKLMLPIKSASRKPQNQKDC